MNKLSQLRECDAPEIVIGTLGNLALLHRYCILYFSGYRSRSTDVILRHLTVANSIVILSRGIPETMAAFGLKHFLNDVGCKLDFLVHRVGRGVSVSTTCLLSVFQAITISPRSSRWAELKVISLKYIGPCSISCWVLHTLLNIRVPMLMTTKGKHQNLTKYTNFQYCSAMLHDKGTDSVFAALTLSHDILCLELMVWASGSMVFILFRHKQQVHHVHRHSISSRPSPETRASQRILLLVSFFVFFYTLSSVIHVWFYLYDEVAWWMIHTSALINACFPAASPFILMLREQCVSGLFWKNLPYIPSETSIQLLLEKMDNDQPGFFELSGVIVGGQQVEVLRRDGCPVGLGKMRKCPSEGSSEAPSEVLWH
ncbi:vomeronasal type-1 receptor 4-like [Erethizon dorsatum]